VAAAADVAGAALAYARHGWSVVPVHTPMPSGCSCGRADCAAVGKHPRIRWEAAMERAASEAEVAAWWRRWPDANVGVVTGPVSGVVVLDVDPRHGGEESLAALEAHGAPLPATPESLTGGGGRHLWLAGGGELPTAELAPGVELKAARGAAAAPPSLHASGRRYAWAAGRSPDDLAPAPVPAWLAALAHGVPGAGTRHPLAGAPVRTTRERGEFAAAWSRAGIALRPGDRTYLCPFHPDTRPSLHVDADGCRWFCFGCRRGGGIGALLRALGEPSRTVARARARGWIGPERRATLEPGQEVAVVGESHHQDALLELAGGVRPYGGVDLEAVAELIPAVTGRVRRIDVRIAGLAVGWLADEDAERLWATVAAAVEADGIATCHARVRGGWDRGGGDVGLFGVVVLLPG
jgi:hypothetical protein